MRTEWTSRHSMVSNARRTAALVNVLLESDPTVETVAEVLSAYGEIDAGDLSETDVIEMRAAAARLREVFEATEVSEASERLNRLLAATGGKIRLSSHCGTTPWHPHLDRDDEGPLGEWFLASSSLAMMALIWDRQAAPGGVCQSPSCANVFLTENVGVAQRYCSRRCATRERVRAHRRSN